MTTPAKATGRKPLLLDLFCGAGGAAEGYSRAGFGVVGVDIKPQPHYPFEFIQMDAIEFLRVVARGHSYHRDCYAAIHASPPCQKFSVLSYRWADREYQDLIDATRWLLVETGLPYIIENVQRAPMGDWVMLCGSSMGLDMIRRHRKFESNVPLWAPACDHKSQTPRFPADWQRSGRKGLARVISIAGTASNGQGAAPREARNKAMGIDWMSQAELAQAIPPQYTHFLGTQLMAWVKDHSS